MNQHETSEERSRMQLYAILRRSAWSTPGDLEISAAKSARVGDEEMPNDICWIRSYVLDEVAGAVGTVCIYQASSADKVREHATRVGMAADEVIPIADTVILRPDPESPSA